MQGLCAAVRGRRAVFHGLRAVLHGLHTAMHARRAAMHVLLTVMYGLRAVVHGHRALVHGLRARAGWQCAGARTCSFAAGGRSPVEARAFDACVVGLDHPCAGTRWHARRHSSEGAHVLITGARAALPASGRIVRVWHTRSPVTRRRCVVRAPWDAACAQTFAWWSTPVGHVRASGERSAHTCRSVGAHAFNACARASFARRTHVDRSRAHAGFGVRNGCKSLAGSGVLNQRVAGSGGEHGKRPRAAAHGGNPSFCDFREGYATSCQGAPATMPPELRGMSAQLAGAGAPAGPAARFNQYNTTERIVSNMNAKQTHKLASITATESLLKASPMIIANAPGLPEKLTMLSARVDEINRLAKVQTQPVQVRTAERNRILDEMTDMTLEIAGFVRTVANELQLEQLALSVRVGIGSFRRARRSHRVWFAQRVADAAQSVIRNLGVYGVTAETLATLQERIDIATRRVNLPRETMDEKMAATKRLVSIFKEVDSMLENEIDPLVFPLRKANIEFHARYRATRSIINQPRSHAVTSTPAPETGDGTESGTGSPPASESIAA
jgi:hypothetical protein